MQRWPRIALGATLFVATTALTWAAPAAAQHDDDFPWLTERKILGTNNLEPIEATTGTPVYDYARAVARVEVIEDAYPYCTATQVGDGIFLTNYHCDHGCETMQFRLGYEKDRPTEEQRVYKCQTMIKKNETLDYALFTAEAPAPYEQVSYPILSIYSGNLKVGLAAMVPQHPTGRFKEVDRSDDCVISEVEVFRTESGRDTIKHMCDTQGGSSGAPVIDRATGHVVALHWGGRDGEFNMAIPATLILADLAVDVPADVMARIHVAPAAVPAD